MAQKEEMSVLCRIVLPAVLRLDALAVDCGEIQRVLREKSEK